MKDHIGAYLQRYAEPDSAAAGLPSDHHEHVLVVPAFDEDVDFVHHMLPADGANAVVLVVANVPDNLSDDDPRRLRSQRLAAAYPPGTYVRGAEIVVIDRTRGPGLPRRQGVGLARKLGADTALRWIRAGAVSEPIIYSSDADALLPSDYFQAIAQAEAQAGIDTEPPAQPGTWLFPYRHHGGADDGRVATYELHLRHYVDGLAHAGSAYAFHTLGSTIAVRAEAYAAVRGYPRRNAAEDFYLLNKLAKVQPIRTLASTPLQLSGRLSERVPFGTGPALRKMTAALDEFASYAPQSFELLREFIEHIKTCDASDGLSEPLHGIAAAIGWPGHERRSLRQKAEWFDAFRTLKFIHAARALYPDTPLLPSVRGRVGEATAGARELNEILDGRERRRAGLHGAAAWKRLR